MSSANGVEVIRIGRKGKRSFALGDGPPVEIDVVKTYNAWLDIDRSFRDEKGELPPLKRGELDLAAWQFTAALFHTEDLTLAEALEFLKHVSVVTRELSAFFVLPTAAEPSSPESTELTFSE